MDIATGNSSSKDTTARFGNMIMDNDIAVKLQLFMDEVETYMTYKIASYINIYWFPILIPIGLVGNTLSFLVMIQPNNRKNVNLYLHGSHKCY